MPAPDTKKPPPCAVINPISGVQRPMLPTIRMPLPIATVPQLLLERGRILLRAQRLF